MKKITFIIGSISLFLVGISHVEAAPRDDDDTKKATFELIDNPGGTLHVEAADLLFGKQTITSKTITAIATNDTSVKVSEYSGDRTGWTLQVQMSKFTDGTNDVNGAQLFFPNVIATGGASNVAPVASGQSDSFLNNLKGVTVSDDDTPVTLAGAKAGKGFGDWELPYKRIDDNNTQRVQLKIPAGQKLGEYSSVLTYSIIDTPVP